MTRAPKFWNYRGPVVQILRPLGALTAAITARRVAKAGMTLDIPVICIGNINVGGTGKTPTAIVLIQMLAAHRPFVVARGYGGRLAGPLRVDPTRHTAADVGDEPLLLSAFAPVIVARDRAQGAIMARAQGAGVIVLDDGFQNPSLHKNLSIVVVDAEVGFGNGLCLPAGPLREPIAAGLSRADMLLSIGGPAAQAQFSARFGAQIGAMPHLTGALAPVPMGIDWQGANVIAFAGIGRPEKFFATLRALGANLVHSEALPDHAALPSPLLDRLLAQARHLGADVVTTEKDAVRLMPRYRAEVLTLPVRLSIANPAPLVAALGQLGIAPD